ncbi:hypothetical protein SAMN05421810_10257 [Amycolatopsis arida]|uniref:Voltage-gated potassium channel n=1 Tax=Amycolatopsis arida TaxID=587909 RepID=A0A1I5NWF1_9PSEU|nr:hypothetical protein [Amycolatopsis arida]TDX98268.1 hypothetical protein CLV69_10157 [Amycolatopsis arida]SFP26128.1 hypothetical protein SAMN05421810_10257 [Amycolatopsis arida]
MSEPDRSVGDTRAERLEARLTVPVLLAALVSVPAVFLTTAEGPAADVGRVLNWASLVVLAGESLVLLWLSRNVPSWLSRHRWKLAVLVVAVPAVVFVVGPAQVLRLLLSLGALRVLRVGRIVRAGRVIRRRAGLGTRPGRWLLGGAGALAVAFTAIVLADPTSRSRRLVEWVLRHLGVAPALLGGLVLAIAATLLLLRRRRR